MFKSQRNCDAVFSYTSPKDGVFRHRLIEVIEHVSGRARLEKMYIEHRKTLRPEDNVWAVAVRGMQLDIVCNAQKLVNLPKQGPLVVVANHPFGFIDGLVLCYLVSTIRREFKIFINDLMCRVPEVQDFMLPISFAGTADAASANARTRATARAFVKAGGCLIVFPSGAVSTSKTMFGPALDCEWHPFAGRLIQQCRAAVLPVYFKGQNTRLFQVASHISLTLRLSLLMRELTRRMGTAVEACIGDVIPFETLSAFDDPGRLMQRLRHKTYQLATSEEPAMPLEVAGQAGWRSRTRLTTPAGNVR